MKINIKVDKAYQFISHALRFIFVNNPRRTSLAIILGTSIHTVATVFQPAIEKLANDYVDPSAFTPWSCIFLGLGLIYLPTIISFIGSPKKELLDEDLEKVFRLLNFAFEKGLLSTWKMKNLITKLCERVVERVDFDPKTQEELKRFLEEEDDNEDVSQAE